MYIPLASTITLVMEVFIGFLIFYIIIQGYKNNHFSQKITFFAIGYEVIFNVGYMIYRTIAEPSATHLNNALKIFAMMHGILSLIMLIAVIMFFMRASREYSQKINSFFAHKFQTIIFCILWTISLVSGIFLYIKIYF